MEKTLFQKSLAVLLKAWHPELDLCRRRKRIGRFKHEMKNLQITAHILSSYGFRRSTIRGNLAVASAWYPVENYKCLEMIRRGTWKYWVLERSKNVVMERFAGGMHAFQV